MPYTRTHTQIHIWPALWQERKAAFLRTCDAMLHGRRTGETFGLAVAEFSVCNRPVITSSIYHENNTARFHLDTLGQKGIYYHDCASLVHTLKRFDRTTVPHRDWNAYRSFQPAAVMQIFRQVFLGKQKVG